MASTEEASASTEQTSASDQEIAASAQALSGSAEALTRLVAGFRVSDLTLFSRTAARRPPGWSPRTLRPALTEPGRALSLRRGPAGMVHPDGG